MKAPSTTPFSVSVYASSQPLGKRITRGPDGSIKKESLGQIVEGTVKAVELKSLRDFADLRAQLTTSHALGYGLTSHPIARVVTKAAFDELDSSERIANGIPTIPRDSEHLRFSDGPGVLMIDHDPAAGDKALGAEELREVLCVAMPELRGVSMLWVPSAGSMVYAGDTEVVGLRGSRIYFVVSDSRRIPAVGTLLFHRLTLAGHGRIFISRAGRMLQRGPIDATVWEPERLDFVRATCGIGLEQQPAEARLFGGDDVDLKIGETLLNVDAIAPLTPDDSARMKSIWTELSGAAEPEANRVRHAWALARVMTEVRKEGVSPNSAVDAARVARYENSALTLVLESDQILTLQDGREVTVADLRKDPSGFEGVRMADPLEPEYGNDPRIAKAYLLRKGGKDPAIYSHAHGGIWYSLRRYDEDFYDPEEPARTSSPVANQMNRFAVQRVVDFCAGPPSQWHIRGVLPKAELCVIYGESGSGKSFAVLDMVAAIVSGEDWRGRQVTQGSVVYVVAEGRAGFRKRLDALQKHREIDLRGLGIVAECPNLLRGDEVELAAAIKAAGGASVLVIDTLAQAMAGGDENSAVEMGAALSACKEIHNATGATVVLVHHSGKDRSKGARGWSGLRAAADAELEITRPANAARRIRVSKQKDGDDSAAFEFELDVVPLGLDDDLSPITSCVVRHFEDVSLPPRGLKARPRGKWQCRLWNTLARQRGSVSRDELVAAAVEQEAAPDAKKRDTRRQQALRALEEMLLGGSFVDRGDNGLCLAT